MWATPIPSVPKAHRLGREHRASFPQMRILDSAERSMRLLANLLHLTARQHDLLALDPALAMRETAVSQTHRCASLVKPVADSAGSAPAKKSRPRAHRRGPHCVMAKAVGAAC